MRGLPGYQRWLRRGWLVMMRARHLRALTRQTGCLARLRQFFGGAKKLPDADPIIKTMVSDVELLEMGRDGNSLAWVVFTVVELEEEGLFRHIVEHL